VLEQMKHAWEKLKLSSSAGSDITKPEFAEAIGSLTRLVILLIYRYMSREKVHSHWNPQKLGWEREGI
jgi:hypothetical protein